MRKNTLKFGAVALSMLLLAGCGGNTADKSEGGNKGKDTSKEVAVEESSDKTSEADEKNSKAFVDYLQVINNPSKVDYDTTEDAEVRGYTYTLVKFKEFEVPVMLIGQDTTDGITYVKAIYYDNGMKVAKDSFPIGVASRGGFRGSVHESKNGDGVLMANISSGTGDGDVERFRIHNGSLVAEQVAEIKQLKTSNNIEDEYKPITWSPTDNPSLLMEKMKITGIKKKMVIDNKIETAKKAGAQIFEGTVKILTREEVLDAQNEKEPNPGEKNPDDRYAVFIPEKPVKATFRGYSGENTENEIKMISLGGGEGQGGYVEEEFKALNGKKVILAAKPEDGGWPTDTTVPLGQPFVKPMFIMEK